MAKKLSSRIRWSFLHTSFRQRCSGCRKKMLGSRLGKSEDVHWLLLEAKVVMASCTPRMSSLFSSFRPATLTVCPT
jgi:hypothetical protein